MRRAEHEQRVQALMEEFEPLFGGDNIGFTIQPGWFSLVQRACREIDAALDPAEKPAVRFLQIKEKMGGLRLYVNVLPVRLDFFGPEGAGSGYFKMPARPKTGALSDRIMPIVLAAEDESYRTCLFCGAPGRLRDDRRWILTLCDRHEPYGYHHLDLAFEQMTDPDREPVPPTRDQVVSAIRVKDSHLRALGVRRLGLLPPVSAAGIWRLVVADADDAYEVLRMAQSAVAWPLDLVRVPDGLTPHDVIWTRREQ